MLVPAGTVEGAVAVGIVLAVLGADGVEELRTTLAGVMAAFSISSCSFAAFISDLVRARPIVSGIIEADVDFLPDLTSLLPRELVDVASSGFLPPVEALTDSRSTFTTSNSSKPSDS